MNSINSLFVIKHENLKFDNIKEYLQNTNKIIYFNDYVLNIGDGGFTMRSIIKKEECDNQNKIDYLYNIFYDIQNIKNYKDKINESLNLLFDFNTEHNYSENKVIEAVEFILKQLSKYFKKLDKEDKIKIYIKILDLQLPYLYKRYKINNKSLIIFINRILDDCKNMEWDNSLTQEILKNTIYLEEFVNNSKIMNKIINILQIDDKSKNLLDNMNMDIKHKKSEEIYHSVIAQTNWIEELEYGNVMGLLVKINPKTINISGYELDYIPIQEITHSIIGLDQILEAYKVNNSEYDIYSSVISGYGIGEGNCILPLYISKDHWDLVKLYFDYNLGIIFSRNSLRYVNKHKNIYKNVLLKMINLTFSDENYNSDKWINLLFSLFRTNIELFTYDRTNLLLFIKDPIFRTKVNINTILIDYLLCTDKSLSENVIKYIFEEVIRRSLKNIYRNINVLDSIYDFTMEKALYYDLNIITKKINNSIDIQQFESWLSNLEKCVIFSEKITLLYGIIKMKMLISEKELFNNLDNNYGTLSDDYLEKIKIIILNKKIKPQNHELNGILNEKFINHVNFSKAKTFSISLFTELGLVENTEQLQAILIQSLIQRVKKCRIRAIKNKKYQDPFKENDIILKTGLLISQRFIKNSFNLQNNYDKYIEIIQNLNDNDELAMFIIKMIYRTKALKFFILKNCNKIKNDDKRKLLLSIVNGNKNDFYMKKYADLL